VTPTSGPGRLDGEVVIVTGSTSGLGRVVASVCADQGAAVLVTGRDETRGRTVVDDIAAAAGRARVAFLAADLTVAEERGALVEAAEAAFGPVTVLVNNAVASNSPGDGAVGSIAPDGWARILEVDLTAAADLCGRVIASMRRAGHGSIVNVTSRAGAVGTPGLAAYSAAKGGLAALTRSITADYAREGIRANTVQPGYILHSERDAAMTDERRRRLEEMSLTRLATAEDVAWAVVFLASRESEVISGITLPVDGGSTAVRGLILG
jgi:NAD(P)-dependent dehydrogenase (short-subunit alcohol dehydrogenase family)